MSGDEPRTDLFLPRAVLGGALTALITAGMGLIGALAVGGVLDWSRGAKTLIASVFAIAGFVLGGFRAGLLQPAAPLSNGAAAAVVAYVPLGILQRVLSDTSLRVLNLVFASLLAASFGVFGGFVANNANRQRRTNS